MVYSVLWYGYKLLWWISFTTFTSNAELEKLDLCLLVCREKTFIDGNDLNLNILNHMPLLNKFTFNIRSSIRFYNQISLPSNEYIQQTFKDFENKQIISYIDYFPENKYSQCHIYSYPC